MPSASVLFNFRSCQTVSYLGQEAPQLDLSFRTQESHLSRKASLQTQAICRCEVIGVSKVCTRTVKRGRDGMPDHILMTAGDGYGEASYYKEDGFCLLSGVVSLPADQRHSSKVIGNPILTLPAECRPFGKTLFFTVNAFGVWALLTVRDF